MQITPKSIEQVGPRVDVTQIDDLLTVTMADSSKDWAYAANQLTLTFDLTSHENVVLAFAAKESGDEPHWPWNREGRIKEDGEGVFGPVADFDFDGVAISADGDNWYEVRGLRDLSSRSFSLIEIDLDAAIAEAGLFYTQNFKIRFCQYDNMPSRMDGITIHAIQVTADPLPVDPSLVLHLPMDDNAPSPTVLDKTGKHHQTFLDPGGNPQTDSHSVPGAVGTGLAFDGVDDQISLDTDIVDLSGPFSITFWFATDDSKWQYLFGRNGGAGSPGLTLLVYPDGRVMASLTDNDGQNAYVIAHEAYDFAGYAHLGLVRSATELKLYLNAVLLRQTGVSLSTITPDSLTIGTYSGAFAESSIDDFRIYCEALTSSQIEDVHAAKD